MGWQSRLSNGRVSPLASIARVPHTVSQRCLTHFPPFPHKTKRKRCIPVDTSVGQASREVLDEKIAKDPACRTGMVKSHPSSDRRVGHAIKLESFEFACHSSGIPALETDVAEKVLDGGGASEALSGWKREEFAFRE